jgi:hypothetical protein
MKKLVIMLVLLSIVAPAFSQARLGRSFYEINQEYEENYSVVIDKFKDNVVLNIDMDRAVIKHLFDSNDICILSMIAPKSNIDVQYYVERYNKELVIMSPTEWRFYVGNSIAKVSLETLDDNSIVFFWIFME